MPAILLHYTFVKENTNNDKYFSLTALGGQGPDPFFFYGYDKKKEREHKKEIRHFGSYLHHIDIADAYNHMMEYASKSENKELLYAYIRGIFLHYIVDRRCHPYVFYQTGFRLDGEYDLHYHYLHAQYEGAMDLFYSKKHHTYQPPVKCVLCDDEEVMIISKMYGDLGRYLSYEGIDDDSFYQAYQDLIFAQKGLYSYTGIKRIFFYTFFRKSIINAMCMPRYEIFYKKYDVLNEKKNEWRDPVNNEIKHESIEELLNECQKEVSIIDTMLLKASQNNEVLKELKDFCQSINHDGTKPDELKKYYKLYNPKKEKKS